jgi:hypothetical protein
MDPYEFAGSIPCPHCRVEANRKCVNADGFERRIPCVARVKLADWPDRRTLPDTEPTNDWAKRYPPVPSEAHRGTVQRHPNQSR